MKIMNKFPLKISIVALLTITVIAGVYVLRPAEPKPAAEPEDTASVQQKKELPARTQIKRPPSSRPYLEEPQVDRFRSEPPQWSEETQSQSHFTDTETGSQYIESSQSPKSSRQLPKGRYYLKSPGIVSTEPPQEQPEQFDNKEAKARYAQYLNSLRSRQQVVRDRPDLAEDTGPVSITEEQMRQMNEELIQRLLEEHKDNPEQAEQLRKILNERLEYYRQQRAAAKETE